MSEVDPHTDPVLTAGTVDPAWIELIRATRPTVGAVRLVCVDGPAGAGKTSITAALAQALEPTFGVVPVVHGDELYEGWDVVAGVADRVTAFGMLADRLETWLLEPWRRDSEGAHPLWDWRSGAWSGSRRVPAAPVVLLDGVALASRPLRDQAVLSVWVGADDSVRLDRVLARDGESLRIEMLTWQRDESIWHDLDGTRAGVDARVWTT